MVFQLISRLALISEEHTNAAAYRVFLSHSHKVSPSAASCHETNQHPTFTIQCAQQHTDTNPMQHNPSGEANSSSASQEIPLILWKPEVQYRVHKCLSLVPILSQNNPFSHLSALRSILILSSHLFMSSKLSPSPSFHHKNPVCISLLPTRAACPVHLILSDLMMSTKLSEEYKS